MCAAGYKRSGRGFYLGLCEKESEEEYINENDSATNDDNSETETTWYETVLYNKRGFQFSIRNIYYN